MWTSIFNRSLTEKETIFPKLSSFFSNAFNHGIVEDALAPKLYPDKDLYLEKQWNLGCWAHCLFAVLGNKLHKKFRDSPWLTAALIAFVTLNPGDLDLIEPVLVCERPINEEGELNYLEIVAAVMNSNQSKQKVLAKPMSQFIKGTEPPPGTLDRFIQILNANPISIGLIKLHAHFLFTSLNCPMMESNDNNENDIYIGARHWDSNEVVDTKMLIEEFHANQSNVLILAIRLKSTTEILHYVTIWISESNKELFYFDPMKGIFRPTITNHFSVGGYALPLCLQVL
jgi:hypothetical protein